MKKSNYSLLLQRYRNHKTVYSLVYFKGRSNDIVIELQTNSKYKMKMRLDLLGLRFKEYHTNLYSPHGPYGQVWFK